MAKIRLMSRLMSGRMALPAAIVVGVSMAGVFMAVSGHPVAGAATTTSSSSSLGTKKLPASYVSLGETLFQTTCSSCHGPDASGTSRAPNLQGIGEAAVDFWVSTGRMPLANSAVQPVRKPPRFNLKQSEEIAAYVASLAPAYGPGIPVVDTKNANLVEGESLFVLNCAACHTITGSGDALADGYAAPTLHKASSTQAAEALLTGPSNMPLFHPGALTASQVADVVAYVTGPTDSIQHPNNAGGLGLGGIGPVAEGFIGLLIGVGGLMLIAFWMGERA